MDKETIILAMLAIIAIMNTVSFMLMGHDKRCARQGKWRVPEKTLFLVTACFGGLGILGVFFCTTGDLWMLHWPQNNNSCSDNTAVVYNDGTVEELAHGELVNKHYSNPTEFQKRYVDAKITIVGPRW